MSSLLRISLILILCTISGFNCFAQNEDIVGPAAESEILQKNRIYKIYAQRYNPDSTALQFLQNYTDTVTIKVFFGSWCKESKKYIPGFIKTMQLVDRQNFRVEYIGIDAQKKYLKSLSKKFHIKYIPTVVVLKGYKEVGRIEEIPQHQIETDLVEILKEGSDQ